MKQWEIWTWQFPGGLHPAVIVSHPRRIANKEHVNILMCSSQRAARAPEPHEVLLDQSDGLNWETLCRCDLLYIASKSELKQFRGTITQERQRQIVRRVISSLGWEVF